MHEDGRRFVTEAYSEAHYEFKYFHQDCYAKKIKKLIVIFPGCTNWWKINVWEDDGIKELVASFKGEVVKRWDVANEKWISGLWLVENEIWLEDGVEYYSTTWIVKELRRRLGRPVLRDDVAALRRKGNLTRFFDVPETVKPNYSRTNLDPRKKRGDGRTAVVHHEDEVFAQLGIGRKAERPAPAAAAPPAGSGGGCRCSDRDRSD